MDSINHVYDKVLSGYLYTDVFVYRDWPEKFLGKNLGLDEINLLKENEAVLRRNLEEILGTFLLNGRLSDSIWIKDKIFIGDEGICLLGEILTICQISTYIDSEEMTDIRSNDKFKNNMMQKLNKKLMKRKNALLQEQQTNPNKEDSNKGKESGGNIPTSSKTSSDSTASIEKTHKNKHIIGKKNTKEISLEEFILPPGEDLGYKYICILLNTGGKQQVRILRFEKNCTYGDKLLETLKKTVMFLHNLRYLFKEFRSQVVLKEKIRREFHAFINFRRSDPNFTGSKAIPEFFNSLHQKAIQPLYLGLNEHYLSLLEEAISYCPIVTYAFYSNIFLLKNIDVNMPRRTWRSVSNLQRKYKNWKKMLENDGGLLEESKDQQKEAAQIQRQESSQEEGNLMRRGSSLEGSRANMVKLFKTYGGQCRIGKVHGRCEDATFQTDVPPAFGIFDGVGSWSLEGIDASKFSIGLALACQREAEKLCNNMNGYIDIPYNTIARSKTLLKNSHESVKADYNEAYGSSTAIVGIIDEFTGKCGISSLGDSVCMILRREFMPESITFDRDSYPKFNAEAFLFFNEKGRNPSLIRKVIWKTTEQKWDNGAPYQLSNLPGRSEWKDLERKGLQNFVKILEKVDIEGDSPEMANGPASEILCMPGDLILCMSDGVCDNLFDEEIEAYCTFAISPEEALEMGDPSLFTPAQDIAYAITNIAKRRSGDKVHYKPFLPFIGKYREPNKTYKGGKVDDISCVAVWVVCETEQSVKHILQSIDHVSSLETDPYYTSQLAQNEEELDENLTPIKGYAKNKHKIERVNLEQSAMEASYANTAQHKGKGIMHEAHHEEGRSSGVVPKMSAMFDASETPIKFGDSKRGEKQGSEKCADLSELEFKDPEEEEGGEEDEEEKERNLGGKFDDMYMNQTPSQVPPYTDKSDSVKNLSDPLEDFENIYINTPPIFSEQSSKLNQKNLRNSGANRDAAMAMGKMGMGATTRSASGKVDSSVVETETITAEQQQQLQQQFMQNSFYETPIKGRTNIIKEQKIEEAVPFDDNHSDNDKEEKNSKGNAEEGEEDTSSGTKRKTKRDNLDSPSKLGAVKKKSKK